MSNSLIKLYQVFCDLEQNLQGNTSTVILLEAEIEDKKMQQIAADLCQPATTFLRALSKETYDVRWFAPDAEIMVCGHGAAAATSFLIDHFGLPFAKLKYAKGEMTGKRVANQMIQLALPPFQVIEELPISKALKDGLGIGIIAHYKTENKNIVLVKSEEDIRSIKPNFEELRKDDDFGYIVTSEGSTTDFVSRTFVPHVGQLEDPATGSSHATLTPFWSDRLGKHSMTSIQWSSRGGRFSCELEDNQVLLSGYYNQIMDGTISL